MSYARRFLGSCARGFSIIEVLLGVVLIGAVAALIVYNVSLVNAKERDTQRRTEIDQLTTALEDCYKDACKSAYPTLLQLQDDEAGGWVATHLPTLPATILYDHLSTEIQGGLPTLTAQYQYEPACSGDASTLKCTAFTLRAYQESDPANFYTRTSLNK